jgi:hypothetical protein
MSGMVGHIAAVLIIASAAASPAPVMHEYDRSAKNRTGLKSSDVCLSFRFYRARPLSPLASDNETSAMDEVIHMWKPTRIEWSYVSTPETIWTAQKAGLTFVGALNTIAFDGPDQDAVLFDGSRAVAPWMQSFKGGKGVGWACVNKPPTLPRRIEQIKNYEKLGVNTIQYDDWMFNLHCVFWGGCFCKDCMAGFTDYLNRNASPEDMKAAGVDSWQGFDYREYLKQHGRTSTADYLAKRGSDPLCNHFRLFQILSTRAYFEKLAAAEPGMRLTVNSNASPARIANSFLLDMTDYLVGETEFQTDKDLHDLMCTLKLADALNLPQVVSPHPRLVKPQIDEVRRAIALTYAMGHRMLIPWDVYVNSEADRWFGKPDEYGDIYDFVRSNADLLDGYRAWSGVVVTAPISTDPAAMTAAGKISGLLMRAGYPCRLAAYGAAGEIVHVPVNPNDFAAVDALIRLRGGGAGAEDEAIVDKTAERVRQLEFRLQDSTEHDYRAVVAAVSEACPPAYRVDNANVMVLPRWKPGDPKSPRVVHLVNLGSDGKASVWLSDKVCGSEGASPSRDAVLLQPGKPERKIRGQESEGGMRFDDLDVETWGIIAIR